MKLFDYRTNEINIDIQAKIFWWQQKYYLCTYSTGFCLEEKNHNLNTPADKFQRYFLFEIGLSENKQMTIVSSVHKNRLHENITNTSDLSRCRYFLSKWDDLNHEWTWECQKKFQKSKIHINTLNADAGFSIGSHFADNFGCFFYCMLLRWAAIPVVWQPTHMCTSHLNKVCKHSLSDTHIHTHAPAA